MSCWAVIVAAGRGSRAGLGVNKVFHPVNGRSVRCLDAIERSGRFNGAVVVLSPEDEGRFGELRVAEGPFAIVKKTVAGGATRRDSVCNGLLALPEDTRIVAIHDAARPFVTTAMIDATLDSARACGSGVISTPVVDTIKHKTPVLVVEQRIREQKGHKFAGYLKVVRLDTHHMIWVDVKQFVTVPYWTMDLEKAVQYGYVIAVYRNNSRYEPMDNKKHRGTLPDGLRVLMCDTKTARYFSKEPAHNPLLGIVFRSKEEKDAYYRTFLFFNRDDLSMVY